MDTQATPPQVSGTVSVEERPRERVSERAGQILTRVFEEIRDEASRRVRGFLTGQKDHMAEEFHKTAEVFRQSSRQFEEREQAMTAKYVNEIAAQADRFSQYLGDRDLSGLGAEIETVARKNPMIFLLGAFTGGFVLSRFLRSPGTGSPASR